MSPLHAAFPRSSHSERKQEPNTKTSSF